MRRLKLYSVLFAGVFALSTSAIWVRVAGAPAEVTAFYRLFLTAAALLPFFLLRRNCRQEAARLSRQ